MIRFVKKIKLGAEKRKSFDGSWPCQRWTANSGIVVPTAENISKVVGLIFKSKARV